MKKIFAIFTLLLVVICAVGCNNENAYLKPIENYYNLMIDFNRDNLEQCAPAMVWEYFEHEYGTTLLDIRNSLGESAEEYVNNLEDEYGSNIAIQVEITTVEEIDDESYEFEIESLAECGIDQKDIQGMKTVTYKIKITGSNRNEEKSKWDDIVKIKGKWYLCDLLSDIQWEAEHIG